MAEHFLADWRENRFDCQSTIYICACGKESGSRAILNEHVRIEKMDLW